MITSINIFLPHEVVIDLPDKAFPRYTKQTAMWILWQIQRRDLFRDWDIDYNGAELSKRYLQTIHYDYLPYMRLFEQLNIININHKYCHYENTGLTKRYKIRPGNLRWYQLDKKSVINSYLRLLSRTRKELDENQKKRLEYLKSIHIDLPSVKSWLKKSPKTDKGRPYNNYEKQLILFKCILINKGEVYLIQDRYTREHTPMTNLSSIIRNNFTFFIKDSYNNYIKYRYIPYNPRKKGENSLSLCGGIFSKPTEYDIPASQPRCFVRWLNNKNINQEEYKRYINMIVEKDFYTEFANEYNNRYGTSRTRNDMKKPLLSTMYGKPSWSNRYTKIYQSLFPTIWKCLCEYKWQHCYKTVAQELQAIEAKFIFDWCETIEAPYFTVHDAVYVSSGDYKDSFDIMVNSITENI